MKKKVNHYVMLGLFVAAGLFFLILMLYLIGKNKHLFGSAFSIRARFENIQGLKKGNNVRYAGIDIGTVDDITVINDTLIEVVMRIESPMKKIIKKNTVVSIGTDGLVGNKVVNMIAAKDPAGLVTNNDLLPTKKPLDTDEMLQTLNKTNRNLAIISTHLRHTTEKIDSSTFINNLLNNTSMIRDVTTMASHLKSGSLYLQEMSQRVNHLAGRIDSGQGTLGKLVTDTMLYHEVSQSVQSISNTAQQTTLLAQTIQQLAQKITHELDSGKSLLHQIFKDSGMAVTSQSILSKADTLAGNVNELSEALKRNIFFRGYFRKQKRQKPSYR